MSKYIVISRHGEREDRYCESLGENWIDSAPRPQDPSISPPGREQIKSQAIKMAAKLKDLGVVISHTYSSPTIRCVQTSNIYSDTLGLTRICVEDGLVEDANAMRGRKAGEPRPNWNPLLLDSTALSSHSDKIDAAYKTQVRVQHQQRENGKNDVCELHHSDSNILDAATVLHDRVQAVLAALTTEISCLGDSSSCLNAILVVTHGAIAERLSDALYGQTYGKALTGSFTAFRLDSRGTWIPVWDTWNHAEYVGHTSTSVEKVPQSVTASPPAPAPAPPAAHQDQFSAVSREVADGVIEYTVSNGSMTMVVLNYGCTILSVLAPDKHGTAEEVTLAYRSFQELVQPEHLGPYYGAVVGRVANRIAGAKFDLNDKTYTLAANNGSCSLHGGLCGFDKKIFKAAVSTTAGKSVSLVFTYTSVDDEEGYPGTLDVAVSYVLTTYNTIEMTFQAVLADPAQRLRTPVNLTNHSYFNLSGNIRRNIADHKLRLSCSKYTPYDDNCIPTGQIRDVKGTAFDFTADVVLGERIHTVLAGGGKPGLDHNWAVDGVQEAESMRKDIDKDSRMAMDWTDSELVMCHAATLSDDVSGRRLTLHSSQPGLQVYTYNWASEDLKDFPHTVHNGIALETQHFPNSVNTPSFPAGSVLAPGDKYLHKTVYSFSVYG